MALRILTISVLCLMMVSCSWLDFGRSSVTVDDLQNKPVTLFNGKNLDNWIIMGEPEGWTVVDGIIHSDGGKGGNWLRSERPYDNFCLTLDYKVAPGGNSGVVIRCTEDGKPWETGYECQISNQQPPRDTTHSTGTLYGYVAAEPRPDESPDVWHSYEILCKNRRIIVRVDGRQTINVDQDAVEAIKNKPLSGYIGLQDSHTGEGMWVEYRNIEIREL